MTTPANLIRKHDYYETYPFHEQNTYGPAAYTITVSLTPELHKLLGDLKAPQGHAARQHKLLLHLEGRDATTANEALWPVCQNSYPLQQTT